MESREESDDETWGCVVEQERPQVGIKTAKSSPPSARKCINVHCHEEKRNMKKEITLLKQEIEDCKYPLSPYKNDIFGVRQISVEMESECECIFFS